MQVVKDDHITHLGCSPKWLVAVERTGISGLRSRDMWHAECGADRIQFLSVIPCLREMFGYG